MAPERVVLVQEVKRGRVHLCPVGVPVVLGRDKTCRLHVQDKHVSRKHCELYAEPDGRLRLRDQSTFGTTLNGQRVEGERWASPGDLITVGKGYELRVLPLVDPQGPRRDLRGLPLVPGWITPRYLLLQLIGRGGAGLVYETWDAEAKQRLALKLLVAGGPAGPELVARFKREALLQAQLRDYPGIVAVRDFDVVPGGELFFTMDYVPGGTLRDLIKTGIPLLEAVHLVARIARAVDWAHQHGIVHRDLKPANVMVSDTGAIRLTDFGVCKALEDREGLTVTGVMLGTPNFMAPEQVEDAKRVGHEADIYSLGGILYQAVTGKLPFAGETIAEILERVVRGILVPPRELVPDLDPELEAIVLRALRREQEERWPSAMEMARALEAWLRVHDPKPKVSLRPATGPIRAPGGAVKTAPPQDAPEPVAGDDDETSEFDPKV